MFGTWSQLRFTVAAYVLPATWSVNRSKIGKLTGSLSLRLPAQTSRYFCIILFYVRVVVSCSEAGHRLPHRERFRGADRNPCPTENEVVATLRCIRSSLSSSLSTLGMRYRLISNLANSANSARRIVGQRRGTSWWWFWRQWVRCFLDPTLTRDNLPGVLCAGFLSSA